MLPLESDQRSDRIPESDFHETEFGSSVCFALIWKRIAVSDFGSAGLTLLLLWHSLCQALPPLSF